MGGGGSVGSRPLPKCVCVAVLCHELCLFLWLLVRWEQIALCGHATVGAAHALASEGFIPRCQVGVSTGSGVWGVSVLTPFCGQGKVDFISKSGPLATSIEGTPRALAICLAIPVLTVLSQANGSRWTFQLRLWRRFLTLKRARPLRNWCVRVAGVVLYPPCACSGNNGAARRLLLASRTCQASPSSAGTVWI